MKEKADENRDIQNSLKQKQKQSRMSRLADSNVPVGGFCNGKCDFLGTLYCA